MVEITPAQIEDAVECALARGKICPIISQCMRRADRKRAAFDQLRLSGKTDKMSFNEYQQAYKRAMLMASMTDKEKIQFLKNELAILAAK